MELNGEKNSTPVAGSDFYPTLVDLTGNSMPEGANVEGKSIVPVLEGKPFDERPLYWHYPHYGNQGGRPSSIIRKGNWKLIHYWEDGHDELYNLAEDIHEDNDLSDEEPDRTAQMRDDLLRWLKEKDAKYPTPDPLYDEEVTEKNRKNRKVRILKGREKQRREMLNENWEPNTTWWGSNPTVD